MNYNGEIRKILDKQILSIELVSETSNKVFKVGCVNGKILYVKFYEGNSSHIDNELKVYELVDRKYLKELYYKAPDGHMAIFKELVGKTVDELTSDELSKYSDSIVDSVIDYFEGLSKNKVTGYGLLDGNLCGKYKNFHEFLIERQNETSTVLSEYGKLSGIFDLIFNRYREIIEEDNLLVPIDTNMKNIMVCDSGKIIFSDPGEMISGPILMGYGDFVAHTYKTVLYDKLVAKLKLSEKDGKLLRIYAIFSSLNVLAFLKKLGVNELEMVVPFGNKYTFFELIDEHLKYLDLA